MSKKHNEKYIEHDVRGVLKLITTSNCIRKIKINQNLVWIIHKIYLKTLNCLKLNKIKFFFPIFEIRTSSISHIGNMT